MRCPKCQADNDDTARTCAACGAALKPRRPRRRADDGPASPEAEAFNREVTTLYRWSLLALVPVAGLVVGPLVALRARRFMARVKNDPALASAVPVDMAFWLGVVSGALSWLGLGLVALGLWWR